MAMPPPWVVAGTGRRSKSATTFSCPPPLSAPREIHDFSNSILFGIGAEVTRHCRNPVLTARKSSKADCAWHLRSDHSSETRNVRPILHRAEEIDNVADLDEVLLAFEAREVLRLGFLERSVGVEVQGPGTLSKFGETILN
jgi:hypothetical protein